MKKTARRLCSGICLVLLTTSARAQLTIEQCHQKAMENYPLIKQYKLVEQSTRYTLDNANMGYLPRLHLSAQATYQSDVMAYPESLEKLLSVNGNTLKGIKKDQYKIALELNQVVWDGGNIQAQKKVARQESQVKRAELDVRMYELRHRVNELFFGILMLEEKITLNSELQKLLMANLDKMQSLEKNGIAIESDVDAIRAEYLGAKQAHKELTHTKHSFQQMLALFVGLPTEEIQELQRPHVEDWTPKGNNRPELIMYEAQLLHTRAQRKLLNSGLYPRLSIFAQGFYGYPGLNMFEDMFSHKMDWDGMVGVKLSWNISNLYTHKNSQHQLDVVSQGISNMRDVFLFNNSMQSSREMEEIEKYRSMLADDEEIIRLRTSIRKSAEKKLEHGVIDVNNLLQEITRENNARTERSAHEIEMLKAVYQLRHTLNQQH